MKITLGSCCFDEHVKVKNESPDVDLVVAKSRGFNHPVIGLWKAENNLMLKKNISIDDTLVNFATQMILIITNSDIKHSEKELRLNSEKRILFGISKLSSNFIVFSLISLNDFPSLSTP